MVFYKDYYWDKVRSETANKSLFSPIKLWLATTIPVAIAIPIICYLVALLALKTPDGSDSTKIAFTIGSLSIAWYGIFIFFGFALAIYLSCMKLWKLYHLPIDPFYWFCIIAIPLAVIGARAWSFIIGDAHDQGFFDFRSGGLAIEGGVLLVVIVGFIYFPLILNINRYKVRDELGYGKPAVRKVSMWCYVDAIVPTILMGQVLGRIGNYMNQEVYGGPISSGAWYDFVKAAFPGVMVGGELHQPLFIIEAFFNFLMFFIIYYAGEFIPRIRSGVLGSFYFLWYGAFRLGIEPLRDTDYTFTNTYIMSGIWVGLAVILIVLQFTAFIILRRVRWTKPIRQKTDDEMSYYVGK